MIRSIFFLLSSMMIMAQNDQIAAIELTKSSASTYAVNVIKISDKRYKSYDEKHHYAVDPEVEVIATPDSPSDCPETIVSHFYLKQLLTRDKFGYKTPNGKMVVFKLACNAPCKDDEVCTVFGCQLKSLKSEL